MFQMFLCNISDKKGNQKRRKDRLFNTVFRDAVNHAENRVVFCIIRAAENQLYLDVKTIIEDARANAVRSVDYNRVLMYWKTGRRVFAEEQQGKNRADYGA